MKKIGTLDEHWCSVCKRKLDKKKDKYVEFGLINMAEKIRKATRKKAVKPKGLICQDCLDKNPDLQKAIELMVKAGNPLFKPTIQCLSRGECENFKKSSKKGIDCQHIAVIGDRLYCKRSHIGMLKLTREKAEVMREEGAIMLKMLERYIKDPQVKDMLKQTVLEKDFLQHIHIPPSSVVAASNKPKPTALKIPTRVHAPAPNDVKAQEEE